MFTAGAALPLLLAALLPLPWMIAGVVVLHVWALHVTGQNNPAGIPIKSSKDAVPFTPYATIKDVFAVVVFMILFKPICNPPVFALSDKSVQ